MLSELSEPPQYFGHNAALNRKGPDLINWSQPLTVKQTPSAELTDSTKCYVVDIRDAKDYAAGHIPNSVNIALRGRLETWVGIMVPWGSNVMLCGEEEDLKETLHRLHRVGCTGQYVLLSEWQKAGLVILDLRAQPEYNTSHIPGSLRLDVENLRGNVGGVGSRLLPADMLARHLSLMGIIPQSEVVLVPSAKMQDATLVAALERVGHTRYAILNGGYDKWAAESKPVGVDLPSMAVTSYPVNSQADTFTIDYIDVLRAIERRDAVILDVRPADYYTGQKTDEARAARRGAALAYPNSGEYCLKPPPATSDKTLACDM